MSEDKLWCESRYNEIVRPFIKACIVGNMNDINRYLDIDNGLVYNGIAYSMKRGDVKLARFFLKRNRDEIYKCIDINDLDDEMNNLIDEYIMIHQSE